ncbi:MAG: hypothetical protein GY830_04875 [Bacteroidetes bacterium]|nr:hypothetical protein [Bacteroidota bacterium]
MLRIIIKSKKLQKFIASILLCTYSLTSCMQRPALHMQKQMNHKKKLEKDIFLNNVYQKIKNETKNFDKKTNNPLVIYDEKNDRLFLKKQNRLDKSYSKKNLLQKGLGK